MANLDSRPQTPEEAIAELSARVQLLESAIEPDKVLRSITVEQEIQELRAKLKDHETSMRTMARVLQGLERRQSKDERRFHLILRGLAVCLPVLASGILGVTLSDRNQELFQSVAYGLLVGGGVGAAGTPFLKGSENQDDSDS